MLTVISDARPAIKRFSSRFAWRRFMSDVTQVRKRFVGLLTRREISSLIKFIRILL